MTETPASQARQPAARQPKSRQKGLALIVVLWASILLALIAGGVTQLSRGDLNLARNLVDATRAELAADSALNTALYRIATDRTGAWQIDGTVYAWGVPGARVRVRVTDELARIDINAAQPPLLAALFTAAGADPGQAQALADAVVRYRSEATGPTRAGAPQRARRGAAPVFQTTGGLARVPGMTPGLMRRLGGAITVYSGLVSPRPANAPPLVTAALQGGVQPAQPDAPGATPQADQAPAIDRLDAAAGLPQADRPEGALRGRSILLRIEAEARTGDGAGFAREAVVELRRSVTGPYQVRLWRRARMTLFADTPGAS